MPIGITISAGHVEIKAELNDSPTAQAIARALPLAGVGNRWGGEIYFKVPVAAELEPDSRDVLEAGELAYWPPGKMFCLFFGSTPASQGSEIRAASDVNVVGQIAGDLTELWSVPDGQEVTLQAV